MRETTAGHNGPDRLDDTERPRARSEAVDACERASEGEREDEPRVPTFEGVHQHHERQGTDPEGGEHSAEYAELRSARGGSARHDVKRAHSHSHSHSHGHSHGLVDPSVRRSREGLRAVAAALLVLAVTALVQAAIFVVSGSVAILADLIHNAGDALTAVPVGVAFLLRSERAEGYAGLAVVFAIFVSACVAGYEAVVRLIEPDAPDRLLVLALAGLIGFGGNLVVARIRTRAGRRLNSPALVADGEHARVDALVSLGVVLSAAAVALGLEVADPLIALAITAIILRITWQSWYTVRRAA